MENKKPIYIMAQTPRQLAAKYGISVRDFKKLTDKFALEIGERCSLFFTPKQVKAIYECIGIPKYPDLQVPHRTYKA